VPLSCVIAGDQSTKPTGITSRVEKPPRYDSHVRKCLNALWNCGLGVLYFTTQKGYISVAHKTNLTLFILPDYLLAAFQYLKGATGRMERDFSQGCAVIGQGGMAVN